MTDEPWSLFRPVLLGLLPAVLLVSAVWAYLTRDDLTTSAACLDVAAGLKERISTGLYCETLGDPFARAVVHDASRVGGRLSVRQHLPVRFPESGNYAGIMVLAALLVLWLFPVIDLGNQQAVAEEEKEEKKLVERTRAEVEPVLKKEVAQLQQKYPEMKKELEKIAAMPDANTLKPEDVRNDPIKKINQLNKQLNQKKQAIDLAKIEEFKKLAARIRADNQESPVGKLAQSLSKGDFKAAQEALAQIKADLKKAPKTEEEKRRAEELKKELDNLSKKLGDLAAANKSSERELAKAGLSADQIKKALEHLKKEDIEKVKAQLKKQGLSDKEISRIAQQLKKNCAACKMASKLASKLGAGAAGAAGGGQMSQSGEGGFTDASDQLSEMESLEQQLNQLASMSADLNSLKGQLGQGLGQGQGQGPGQGQGRGGMGAQGQGQGGIAPEEETKFAMKREKSPVNTLAGEIISTKYVRGEQFSGEVSEEFVEAVLSAERRVGDAIAREQIPRAYHNSIKDYFDRTRKGLPAETVQKVEQRTEASESQ
jgi:hypothetical protein